MGTPDFAVPSLKILVENGYNIVGVITAPDKPAGRGLKIKKSPVKEYAESVGLTILQPEKLKAPAFLEELKALNANLQIVVAFRMLPEAVWDMPEIGTFNLHGSLLPQYRGAAPIHWAVINGEKETGVTTFFLKHKIDTGDIIKQVKESIAYDDTTGSVYERLMLKGADLVLSTVQDIENDSYTTSPQNEADIINEAPKIFRDTCQIDFEQPGEKVYNLIRGLAPFPSAWTTFNGKNLKVFQAEYLSDKTISNPIESDNKTYLYFKVPDGVISVKHLQIEGKKRMTIEQFLQGNKIQTPA